MKPTNSFFLGLVFLFGISPALQAQHPFPWEFRPLEHFSGDYDAFIKANFFVSGTPDDITMGQWVEYLEKNTLPTYFVINLSDSRLHKKKIMEIVLLFQPLELIKQYVHEKRYFLTAPLVLGPPIYLSDPKFDELVKIGVNRLIPWEEYKKHEQTLKCINISNPWPIEGEVFVPGYLANTPE